MSAVLTVAWFVTRFWILNNVLALSVTIVFLKLIQLSQLKPAILLLTLLSVYDIFWVYLSPIISDVRYPILETVVTNYDYPNKLVLPPIINSDADCAFLGLGDIFIPTLYLIFIDKFGH